MKPKKSGSRVVSVLAARAALLAGLSVVGLSCSTGPNPETERLSKENQRLHHEIRVLQTRLGQQTGISDEDVARLRREVEGLRLALKQQQALQELRKESSVNPAPAPAAVDDSKKPPPVVYPPPSPPPSPGGGHASHASHASHSSHRSHSSRAM